MSDIRWHKIDVVFHLHGGQSVKVPAFTLTTEKRGDELISYALRHSRFAQRRQAFYGRIDSIDLIELRHRGWWRWAW